MVTIDCLDVRKLADFWVAALGAEIIHEVDDGAMLVLSSTDNVDVGLQRVDEPRVGKNRLHLDLGTPDRPASSSRSPIVHCSRWSSSTGSASAGSSSSANVLSPSR